MSKLLRLFKGVKKLSFLIFVFALVIGSFDFVFAYSVKTEINFFYSLTCPHCAKERVFLEKLEKKYPELEVKRFPLSKKENINLLLEFYEKYNVPSENQGFVPISFIGGRYFLGFNEKIAQDIESYVLQFIEENSSEEQPSESSEGQSLSERPSEEQLSEKEQTEKELPSSKIELAGSLEKKIKLPILGEINPKKFSIPVLAVVLGFFDGFNVCSLGALVLILGIVLALKSRSKILLSGGVFILTTGIIYGILIFLWHRIFLALSFYLRKMEILIGILAIFGAVYFLREFLKFRKKGVVCEFGGVSQKISQRFQKVFEKKAGILTLLGTVFLFASIITVVEFPCSAALPVIFAGVLSEAKISAFLSFLYIGIFLIFYLLDEILVFLISVLTLKIWVASPKFVTFLNLIASGVLFFLGIYYLFGLA